MSATKGNTLSRKRHHITRSPQPPRPADTACVRPYFRRKAILDRALAALLLAPGLPIIGFLMLLVRLTSRGPGIYPQLRVGQNGRLFTMYKIRTMRQDAESASGPVWTSSHHDPRVTLLGRVLRRLHLDELPQLLNVVKGEMSLVGPRPERPEFVRVLAEAIPGYRKRLAVRPGVTGLAQLNLPPDTDLASVHRKLLLDCEYVREAGLWLDFRLLAGTFFRMFKLPERWLLATFALRRTATAPEGLEGSFDGDASALSAATPADILAQAAALPTACDGSSEPRDKQPRKQHSAGHDRRRPR